MRPTSHLGSFSGTPINSPIFFLGVQGGGETLVSRMLRRHTDVVSVTGNSSYWTGADEIQNVLGPMLPPELTGIRYKVPNPDHPIYRSPRGFTYANDELLPDYRRTADDATPELKRTLEKVIRMIVSRHASNPETARFTDKSQVYTVRVSLLNALLKEHNPRFILLLMDPYVAAYKAASGRADDMDRLKDKFSLEERLDLCAQHWANSVRSAREDADNNMLEIKFEDVLREPDKILRRICDFVDLEFQEDMLPKPDHKIPFGSRFRDRWFPLRTDRGDEWIDRMESELGRRGYDIVDSHCGALADEFGYSH